MPDLNDFYNNGFGWICRHCERDLSAESSQGAHSRFFVEGESESKQPRLSNPALARWADPPRTPRTSPPSGNTERVEKA
jgi:hypothetical protein